MSATALTGPLTITDGGTQELLLVIAGFLVGLGIIYWGFRTYRTGRLIRDTPTEKARSIAIGRTEVHGTCRDAGTTFDQPFSEGQCVYREWKVEEYKRDHSDDDNNYEWKTHDSGTDVAAFYLEDDTGKVLVDATDDATFQISDENSEEITVSQGASLPDRVDAFYREDDEEAQRQQAEELADAMPDSMLGGAFGSEGMLGDATDEDGNPDPQQFYQQYLPAEMLDEDGKPREDLSDEEIERAMREHAQEQRAQSESDDSAPADGQSGVSGQQSGFGGQRSGGQPQGAGSSAGSPARPEEDESTLGKMKDAFGAVSDTVSTLSSMGGGSRPSRRYKRRFTQEVLPVDEQTYVFGGAYEQEHSSGSNVERLVIRTDEGTGRFIISDRDEAGLARHYTIWAPIYMLVGLLLSAGTLYILLNDWLLV